MYVDTLLSSDKSVNNINSISTYGATSTEQHMSFTYVIQNGAIGWRRGDGLLNKVIIFVFFAHKKYFHGFVKLRLATDVMDYFNDFLFMLMDLDRVRILAVNGRLREHSEFIKTILICVPKMNEGLKSLEQL